MSHKQAIIDEITELFRKPEAFLYEGDAYKVCSWGACKSYLTWPEGAPEGWDDLQEETEFFVGRSGARFVVVEVADDAVTKLYSHSESSVEGVAESICWELDLVDPEWEELS
jgi:hypothetical protein